MSQYRKLLTSKLTALLLLIFLIVVIVAIVRDRVRQQDLAQEIKRQEDIVVQLETDRVKLAELVEALESADFIEREARLRLGLIKPGEQVVSVPADARPGLASTTVQLLEPAKSNPARWFDYLFGAQ